MMPAFMAERVRFIESSRGRRFRIGSAICHMKSLIILSAFWVVLCLSARAAGPVAPAIPSTHIAGDWVVLFDGQNLNAWQPIGSAKWRIENGAIVGGQDGDARRSGVLATKERFQNFEIELEFMIDEHGKYNSGVYLRNEPGRGGRTGYQVNIGRGEVEEYCGLYTDRWLAKGDEKDTIRKKLDWNRYRILAIGGRIIVDLNGVNIIDYTDVNPPAKFLQSGVIALQTYGTEGHAGWVKFRNIRIRPIRPR